MGLTSMKTELRFTNTNAAPDYNGLRLGSRRRLVLRGVGGIGVFIIVFFVRACYWAGHEVEA